MIEERKSRLDEHLRGEGVLALAFAVFSALSLGLLFVPLSLAQQQDAAAPERADGAPLSQTFATTGLRAAELFRDWQPMNKRLAYLVALNLSCVGRAAPSKG